MWWYSVGFTKAISMEVTILIFFFIYTYLFTLVFDKLLPRTYSLAPKRKTTTSVSRLLSIFTGGFMKVLTKSLAKSRM